MKTKLFMMLLGLTYMFSCTNYNHLSYSRVDRSKKTIQSSPEELIASDHKMTQEIKDEEKEAKKNSIETQPIQTIKQQKKDPYLPKEVASHPSVTLGVKEGNYKLLDADPPCSTIVLKDGSIIEARNVKVTHKSVFFQTCDKSERLSISRKEVDRILATNKSEYLERGISESRLKDRHTNVFAVLLFVLCFLVPIATGLLLYYQLWVYAGVVALGFLTTCLIFMFFVNHDLSTLKGVGLMVSATVMAIVNIIGHLFFIDEYI